jgi:signal transduction histidine kinase
MSRPSTRVVIGILGFFWGLASEAVYFADGTPPMDVLRDAAIGWTYLYGGLAIWSSKPGNPTGRLMTLVGFSWFIGNLQFSQLTLVHTIGTVFADVVFVCLIALILAYPSGWLETRLDRVTVAILAIGTTVNNAVRLLPIADEIDLEPGRLYVGLALATFANAVVIRRWVVSPPRRRSELVPVLFAGCVLMAILATSLLVQAVELPPDLEALILAARGLAPAAIPLALLVSFYRQSELRQRSLVDAMPDEMVRFSRDGHLLDVRADASALVEPPGNPRSGRRIDDVLPAGLASPFLTTAAAALESGTIQTLDFGADRPDGRRQFETRITPSGADEVTAIVRDFTEQRAVEAEQRAAQAELRRSRARIVEATDAERRRLERDLHDGAQQRLVSMSLALGLARRKLGSHADPAVIEHMNDASQELRMALVELRELARGIHPAILTEAGLGPAIDTLAARSKIPTVVTALPGRRLSPAIESTAYFVVSEALANVAKYSVATKTTVSAECPAGSLRVEIADDGVGGADPSTGSGLRGLADRVAAVGGTLSIVSPVGGGTRVVAEIPIAS